MSQTFPSVAAMQLTNPCMGVLHVCEVIIDVLHVTFRRLHVHLPCVVRSQTMAEPPTLCLDMHHARAQVSRGKGFHLVRNFPVAEFGDNRVGLVLAFWSLALQLGRPLVRARARG